MFKTTSTHGHADPKLGYFNSGKMIMKTFSEILKNRNPTLLNDKIILDYGCAHGRITRHIKNYLQPSKLVCADVWDNAVNFCAKEFKAIPFVISDDNPISNFKEKFDVIISISVFSHLPPERFEKNLFELKKSMNQGGILFYTTHGRFSAKKRNFTIPEIDYKYGPVGNKPNHTDGRLSVDEYSFMCTTPEYNEKMISKVGLQLVESRETGIGEQDLYVVEKP